MARRTPLVTQHLENISRKVLEAHAVKRPTCNGWTFWKYQRSPGDWVNLDVLRNRK